MAVIERNILAIDGPQIVLEVHSRTNPPNRLDRVTWVNPLSARYAIAYTVWDAARNGVWDGVETGASGSETLPNVTLDLITDEWGSYYTIPETYTWRTTLVEV